MVKRFVEVSSRVLLTLVLATLSGLALAQADQQKLVDQADATLRNFMRDPQMTWLHDNIGKAKAVLVAPEVVKAGFIFGGSGGRAVLIARDGKGHSSDPRSTRSRRQASASRPASRSRKWSRW